MDPDPDPDIYSDSLPVAAFALEANHSSRWLQPGTAANSIPTGRSAPDGSPIIS